MKNTLTPEMMVQILNEYQKFQLIDKVLDSHLLIKQIKDEDLLIISISTFTGIDSITLLKRNGENYKKFVNTLLDYAQQVENLDFLHVPRVRMTNFIFENNGLTGEYYKIKTQKIFYYINGVKQKEDIYESITSERHSDVD